MEHQKVVPLRTTLPVLSCAYLNIEKNTLTIKTTDLEQTIFSNNNVNNAKEGSVCIPMARFTEIISALPSEEITINSNEDNLIEIKNSHGVYKIKRRDTKEFQETTENAQSYRLELYGEDF